MAGPTNSDLHVNVITRRFGRCILLVDSHTLEDCASKSQFTLAKCVRLGPADDMGTVVDTFGHIFVDVGCAIVGFMSQAQTTVPKIPTGEHNHA